jgi:hypothetical protein
MSPQENNWIRLSEEGWGVGSETQGFVSTELV